MIERRLGPVTTRFTASPGDGIGIARRLVAEGFNFLIAVGGDGTANEIVNGIFESGESGRSATLGLIPTGTGGDLRRSLGIPSKVAEAIEILASGVPVPIDVGKITYSNLQGQPATRYFINLASFGMGGDVASRAKQAWGFLGGRPAFFWATIASLASYKGRTVTLHFNNDEQTCTVTNVAVGNGRYHGGGMNPCPTAIFNDGMLDVTVIDRLGAFELLRDIHYLYSSNVYRHPKTHHFRTRELRAESTELTRIEVDGEPLGTLPVEISLAAQRLKVVVGPECPLESKPPASPEGVRR